MLFVYVVEQYVSDGAFIRANNYAFRNKEDAINFCKRLMQLINKPCRVKTLTII